MVKGLLICLLLLIKFNSFGQKVNETDSICALRIVSTIKQFNEFTFQFKRKNIPRHVKRQLTYLYEEKFRIVNPGKNYRRTDVVRNRRPNKELILIGFSNDFILIAFNQGGIGFHRRLVIGTMKQKKVIDLCDMSLQGVQGQPVDILKSLIDGQLRCRSYLNVPEGYIIE
jgi:hypothetical protein